MEGTMSEIRLFGGAFQPKSWAYCSGQLLAISTNQALFSLIGTLYGGNGIQTFGLPDMRGRVPMGTGAAPAVASYQLGQMNGSNSVTASISNLPQHLHNATGSFAVKAFSDGGDTGSPSGASLAALAGLYSDKATDTALRPIDAAVSIGVSGANQPMTIQQPYLGMNYIICLMGIYPSRN